MRLFLLSITLLFSCSVPSGECIKANSDGTFVDVCGKSAADDSGFVDSGETGDADTDSDSDSDTDTDSGDDTGIDPVDNDGDGHASLETGGDDCDDSTAAVYPGADEACNGEDDNCDGESDEGLEYIEYYADSDGDGYGAGAATSACEDPGSGYSTSGDDCDDGDAAVHPYADEDCTDTVDLNCDGSAGTSDLDGDGTIACEDCDDGEPLAYPGNTEVCDGIDNDCEGTTDEDAEDALIWYADSDGDSYGNPDSTEAACDAPFGYVGDDTDCDDGDSGINPGEAEVCDGVDNDCSGVSDDGGVVFETWYRDSDGDGYGETTDTVSTCDGAPAGYVGKSTDCDDGDSGINPGASEVCDGVDNDCEGTVDELASDASTWYSDMDGDSYGNPSSFQMSCAAPSGYVADNTDCDDGRASISPAATETCNGWDDDCDGSTDESGAVGETDWYADADGDGYGDLATLTSDCDAPSGYVADSSDCDDGDSGINPGAAEVVSDGIDQDCDGADSLETDADSDGYGVSTDCDDGDSGINPGASEVCDGVDNDCSGTADDGLAFDSYYLDSDGDSYGDRAIAASTCSGAPAGYVSDDTDCDDSDGAISPGATEACDSVDNDCDGDVDESGSTGESTWYADSDGDGYGDSTASTSACTQPSGYVSDVTDCDDSDGDINPDGGEICDSVDNDCDGFVDESTEMCADSDGDGCGDASRSTGTLSCSDVALYTSYGYEQDCSDPDDYDAFDCTP